MSVLTVAEATNRETASVTVAGLTGALRSALLIAKSVDKSRPILRSVRVAVKDGKFYVAATDRYRLFAASDEGDGFPDDADAAVSVSVDTVGALIRSLPTGARIPQRVDVTLADGELTLQGALGEMSVPTVDGEYPDVGHIIVAPRQGHHEVHLNPKYLADLGTIARYMAAKGAPAQLALGQKNRPLVMTAPPSRSVDGWHWTVMQMPVRAA